MFSNIMGNKNSQKDDNTELIEKISKMNLTDMRLYVKDNMKDFKSSKDGLEEILKKITLVDSQSSKRYIEADDMDVKIKKAFDLVLAILENKNISASIIEKAQNFLEIYKDIILSYDTNNKQIYAKKLHDKLISSANIINMKSDLIKKMNVIQ